MQVMQDIRMILKGTRPDRARPCRKPCKGRQAFGRAGSFVLVLLLLCCLVLPLSACNSNPIVGDDLDEAKVAIQAHDWTLAERLLQRYLRVQQDMDKRWEAWQSLLDVSRASGTDSRTALDYLDAMLQEFFEDEEHTKTILERMGVLNESLRRHDKAADVWSTYIDLGSLTPEEALVGHRRLAQIHIRNRSFDAGEDVLQNCLGLTLPDSGKGLCMYDLADLHMTRERWKDASDLALQVLDMNVDQKTQGLAAFLLGDAMEQQNKPQEALRYFEMARAFYPNVLVVDSRIAFLKRKAKKK